MNNKKSFNNWDKNRILLTFPNGNNISTIWGFGSYTENHMDYEKKDFGESNTCEVMFACSPLLKAFLEKKYNESDAQPIGYLSMKQWLEIVNLIANE